MTDHLRRIREHMALESEALQLQAKRARLFDHLGNRGSEAEESIRRWLRTRFAPDYTISSGEIIDSFDTNADLPSRQQDGILHRNDPEASRFLLPSGMRLVPIETVAAVIEVKLTLTKDEFEKSDRAATETARLRLRVRGDIPQASPYGMTNYVRPLHREKGLSVDDPVFRSCRPMFAIFAFGGVKEIETIASWLITAKMVNLVCCLDAGCALGGQPPEGYRRVIHLSQRQDALPRFAECIRAATKNHARLWDTFGADFSHYASMDKPLAYWEETGSYEHPSSYKPTEEELDARARLYEVRPSLRPKPKT